MRKITLLFLIALIWMVFVPIVKAQQDIPFAWDAPTTDVQGNPLTSAPGHYFYVCNDSAFTSCSAPIDVGTAITYTQTFDSGIYYIFVTAYIDSLDMIEGTNESTTERLESDRSNTVAFRLQIPPGNPANFKIHEINNP